MQLVLIELENNNKLSSLYQLINQNDLPETREILKKRIEASPILKQVNYNLPPLPLSNTHPALFLLPFPPSLQPNQVTMLILQPINNEEQFNWQEYQYILQFFISNKQMVDAIIPALQHIS